MEDKKTRTLFILGAGASSPYGFPIGSDLRIKIINEFKLYYRPFVNSIPFIDEYSVKQSIKRIEEFVDKFKNSHTPSIDLFISRNRSLNDLGKLAITLNLLNSESSSRFGHDSHERTKDWYSYLLQRMIYNAKTKDDYPMILDNNYSFITFNYDRSLEHFLYNGFKNSFSEIEVKDIRSTLINIPIVHVYGTFGRLPWQMGLEVDYPIPDNQFGYGQTLNHRDSETVLKNLNIVFDIKETNQKIAELISDADKIFFLGFSYAPENMEILNFSKSVKKDCEIYCCCYDLTDVQKKGINENYFSNLSVEYGALKCDSLELLKTYLDFKKHKPTVEWTQH